MHSYVATGVMFLTKQIRSYLSSILENFKYASWLSGWSATLYLGGMIWLTLAYLCPPPPPCPQSLLPVEFFGLAPLRYVAYYLGACPVSGPLHMLFCWDCPSLPLLLMPAHFEISALPLSLRRAALHHFGHCSPHVSFKMHGRRVLWSHKLGALPLSGIYNKY